MPTLSELIYKVLPRARQDIVAAFLSESARKALAEADLLPPHRLIHFLAQTAHESARFSTTIEGGGDARANRLYDTRTDLGNTPERDGDGAKYKGRGIIQMTGRANYRHFGKMIGIALERRPELAADPAVSIALACAYWTDRDLNRYADDNNIEMITRRINGGLNGYDDRISLYTAFALAALGYSNTSADIRRYQTIHGLVPDGIAGPVTRSNLHTNLKSVTTHAPAQTKRSWLLRLLDFIFG